MEIGCDVNWNVTYLDTHLDDAEYLDLVFGNELGESYQETGLET
jgi:hypothetical protein